MASKDTPTLAEKFLNTLSSSPEELAELHNTGAITLNKDKIPARLKFAPDELSLTNILRGLLGKTDETSLKNISEASLNSIIKNIAAPDQTNPSSFVDPPPVFGTNDVIASADLESLRQFRKDSRDSVDISTSLDYLNDFHIRTGNKYSAKALCQGLGTILPSKTLKSYYRLIRQQVSIGEIFKALQEEFSEEKSLHDSLNDLHDLSETACSGLDFLEKLTRIVNDTSSAKEIDTLALNEARRFLKRELGPNSATLECFFSMSPNKNLREYVRLAKLHFLPLLKKSNKSRLHHIDSPQVSTNDFVTKADMESFLEKIVQSQNSTLQNQMHNVQSQMHNVQSQSGQITCYGCKQVGHISKFCPKRQSQFYSANQVQSKPFPTPPTKLYCHDKCSIHPQSTHLNSECQSQLTPCVFRINHGGHSAGDCMRPAGFPAAVPPSVQSTPPQQPQQPMQQQVNHIESLQTELDTMKSLLAEFLIKK